MDTTITIVVNGQSHTIRPSTLAAFIASQNTATEALVVEYNHTIIKQQDWECTELREGDNLELLSFVGGG